MAMGQRKKLKAVIGVVRGITSVIKSISTKSNSKFRVEVLRATARNSSSVPSDKRIAAILSFGDGARHTACGCIEALMDRLHGTKDALVALKCLFTIHSIITKGSFILRDQLSFYPSFGGRNFLNLSEFRDGSGPQAWELSSWVRWYAGAIEQNLMVSRFLGHDLYSSSFSSKNEKDKQEKVFTFLSADLLEETDILVDFIEVICDAPDSLHLQKNDLVYEIVRLVAEDYRLVQREVFVRVGELGNRLTSLSFSELTRFMGALQRVENCKGKLGVLFVNRARNDALWDLIKGTRIKIAARMEEMGETKLLMATGMEENSSESTQFSQRIGEFESWVQFDSDPEEPLEWNRVQSITFGGMS
ncbi:hypothetical protein Tsubulata_001601 [Turnera subulata]|uniref:ENTH domain-containing protein n=1 Tax=Turnera subulata TaxID=218843 RepID=A0A9Q0EYE9_9ROSI|nr:hypothetical protein Tsubulata_001601 [Turnera subulata]